jgi:L-alanine-DL-glutamate epimerase-like enolase superfamily enzyme
MEFIPLRVKGTSTLRISKGATQVTQSVIIKVTTDEGLTGIGEAVSSPPGYPEEIQEEIVAALKHYIQPQLLGENPENISDLREKMDRALNGKYWTKAAVINALYDLVGKIRKRPICELLGGLWRDQVPNLAGMVGIDTGESMARKAMRFVEKGATTIKLKIGDTVEADVDRVCAVREAVGETIGMRIDCNSHYQAKDAIRLVQKIEKYKILHVEAPLDKNDILGLAKVKQAGNIPIMSDESVRIAIEAKNLFDLDAVDIIKVKITKMGFDVAETILKMARERGKRCLLGHMLELGVAGTAEAHFAVAHSDLLEPHEIGTTKLIGIREDIIREAVHTDPNHFSLHRGAGLGVSLNEEGIAKSRVD